VHIDIHYILDTPEHLSFFSVFQATVNQNVFLSES